MGSKEVILPYIQEKVNQNAWAVWGKVKVTEASSNQYCRTFRSWQFSYLTPKIIILKKSNFNKFPQVKIAGHTSHYGLGRYIENDSGKNKIHLLNKNSCRYWTLIMAFILTKYYPDLTIGQTETTSI